MKNVHVYLVIPKLLTSSVIFCNIKKRKMANGKYSVQLKEKIINDYCNGESVTSIAYKFGIHHSVISRIISRFRSSGSLTTIHRGGRPRKTTNRDDQAIIRLIKKDPFISARSIGNQLKLNVSIRSIQRRSVEGGLKTYRSAKKPFISAKNRRARIEFAKEHLNWSATQWKTVLFSDESKFNIKSSDGFRLVRRPKGQRLNPRYTRGTVKHGGGNVLVWGCFSGHGIGPIHRINGIMDRFVYKDILENIMLPHAEEEMPLKWRYQQDNDPKHTAKCVKEWFKNNKINVLKWPAQSPDLNPIENLWDIVDRKINRDDCRNADELFRQVEIAWNEISGEILSNLIESMPRRCKEVLKNKGYATKY